MTSETFLQLFLLINVFTMGILAAVAFRHARAHFKPHHDAEKHPLPQVKLPPHVKEQLLAEAQVKFQAALDNSANELQRDMKMTASGLNKQLEKLGTEIVTNEIKRYHASLDSLQKQTEDAIASAQDTIEGHQAELKATLTQRRAELEAKLAADVAAEKERLIGQIDTKLADAVASFLIETLQHDVDLGAQSKYLMAQLEEHKADFKREVSDENQTAK